jgi:uncharacterized membrane protein
MQKKILYILVAVFAVIIGLYPLLYLILDRTFGLLQTKADTTLSNIYWNIGFYGHIFLGGLALLIGWIQFNSKFRSSRLQLHRQIGKVYVIAAIGSSIFGLFIAFFATGGISSVIGFGLLAIIWFYTTTKAFLEIKKGNVFAHEHWMMYSYAACFAAVTLRLWLPVLTFAFNDFFIAYKIVAWLCWVPNLIIASLLVAKQKKQKSVFR